MVKLSRIVYFEDRVNKTGLLDIYLNDVLMYLDDVLPNLVLRFGKLGGAPCFGKRTGGVLC